jgi:hypothetical protein
MNTTPLWNSELTYLQFEQKMNSVMKSVFIGFGQAVVVSFGFVSYHIVTNENHGWIQTTKNIGGYILFVEGIGYIYRRIPFIPMTQKQVNTYPVDALCGNILHITLNTVILSIPPFFLNMNWSEFKIMVYLYMTMGVLRESDVFIKSIQTEWQKISHWFWNFALCIKKREYRL